MGEQPRQSEPARHRAPSSSTARYRAAQLPGRRFATRCGLIAVATVLCMLSTACPPPQPRGRLIIVDSRRGSAADSGQTRQAQTGQSQVDLDVADATQAERTQPANKRWDATTADPRSQRRKPANDDRPTEGPDAANAASAAPQPAAREAFDTRHAYVLARTEQGAKNAQRLATQVADYIRKVHQRDLRKGLIVVVEPGDDPVARTLEDRLAMEQDPGLIKSPPRRTTTAAEIRNELNRGGLPERATLCGSSYPLPAARRRALQAPIPEVPWALVVPSDAMCNEAASDTVVAGMRRQRPDLDAEAARRAASLYVGQASKSFKLARSSQLFIVWANQQADWSDAQRREAIRTFIKKLMTAAGLPAPTDDQMDW